MFSSRVKCYQAYLFIFLYEFAQIVFVVQGGGTYSIIAPGTLHSYSEYNVVASIHEADAPCLIEISIAGPSFREAATIEMRPKSTQRITFRMASLKSGEYTLNSKGLEGIKFTNSSKLHFVENKPIVFIQTDKATYKPGDSLRFRVMILDENLRPLRTLDPITIYLHDGAENLIKQWKNISMTKGVFAGKHLLSEQPVLGAWKISLNIASTPIASKTFDIAKYVLPKFEVIIDTQKDIARSMGELKGTIRAKYTYGKSVKGEAKISVEAEDEKGNINSSLLKAEKTIKIDGKVHFSFDLLNDLLLSNSYSADTPTFKLVAVVEEELTGNKQNTTSFVKVHSESYVVEVVDKPKDFHPDKPIKYKLVAKNLDGSPVNDIENKMRLILRSRNSDNAVITEAILDQHGMATLEVSLPDNDIMGYSVVCQFRDVLKHLPYLSKLRKESEVMESLRITLNTKKPALDQEISITVESAEPLEYFIYSIVGRGNILKSEYVEVPHQRKTHTLNFKPNMKMLPSCSFYVHHVIGNDLHFEELSIDFKLSFENKIDIQVPVQTKPARNIEIEVETESGSYVGLLGVDQSVLLFKDGNDFNKNLVFDDLRNFDTTTPNIPGSGRYPGKKSGLVTFTNANYPYKKPRLVFVCERFCGGGGGGGGGGVAAFGGGGGGGYSPQGRYVYVNKGDNTVNRKHQKRKEPEEVHLVRQIFPETWIFEDLPNSAGSTTLEIKVPDTITTWIITGFSLHPGKGLALSTNPAKLQVFQPFFISINLPYSVKRGEVIAIPVLIFNYMEYDLNTEITMENTDNEFEFTEATNEVVESLINDVKRTKPLVIPSNSGKSVSFMIRPKKIGVITLKIMAVSATAGDTVHQTLRVEPEGITKYENFAVFINLKEQPEFKKLFSIQIPANAISESEYIEFSAMGDLLGPTIKNLGNLVRLPHGCGEQNMVNFVPNILVVKYLKAINKKLPMIEEKALKFLEIGYQRELSYKHDDGSFSAFGKRDSAGSTWLTAYVARSFGQATSLIDIDENVIKKSLQFLAGKQANDGSFQEYGRLVDFAHQNELAMSSFVLLAYLQNKDFSQNYEETIRKTLEYIAKQIEETSDVYALAIAAYVLQYANDTAGIDALKKLDDLAIRQDGLMWWSNGDKDIETSSYILLAKSYTEPADQLLPILKWLISKRNSNGGFSYTQATVLGLQALIEFAEKTDAGELDANLNLLAADGAADKRNMQINNGNALVLQSHVLPKSTRNVELTAIGKGSFLVQLSYHYNLMDSAPKSDFEISPSVKLDGQKLQVQFQIKYEPERSDSDSNMSVMEIALPSGYISEDQQLVRLQNAKRVKRVELVKAGTLIIVYFDGLRPHHVYTVEIHATRIHAVAKQKPVPVKIYDYYDTTRHAVKYYEIASSLCDICEDGDCGAQCLQS